MTPLDQFIRDHEIDIGELARLTKLSATYLDRLRGGRSVPSPYAMERIVIVCSWLARQKIYEWELFDRP